MAEAARRATAAQRNGESKRARTPSVDAASEKGCVPGSERYPSLPNCWVGSRGTQRETRTRAPAQAVARLSSEPRKAGNAQFKAARNPQGVTRPPARSKSSVARRTVRLAEEDSRNTMRVAREDPKDCGEVLEHVRGCPPFLEHAVHSAETRDAELKKPAVLALPIAALGRAEEVGLPTRTPTMTPNAITDRALIKSEQLLADLLALGCGEVTESASQEKDATDECQEKDAKVEGDASTKSVDSVSKWPAWVPDESVETVRVPVQLLDMCAEVWTLYRKALGAASATAKCRQNSSEPAVPPRAPHDMDYEHSPQLCEPEPETFSNGNGTDTPDGMQTFGCSSVSTTACSSVPSSPKLEQPHPRLPIFHDVTSEPSSPKPREAHQVRGLPVSVSLTLPPRDVSDAVTPQSFCLSRSPSKHAQRRAPSPVCFGTRSHSVTAPCAPSQPRAATVSAPLGQSARPAVAWSDRTVACTIQQTVTITHTIQVPVVSVVL